MLPITPNKITLTRGQRKIWQPYFCTCNSKMSWTESQHDLFTVCKLVHQPLALCRCCVQHSSVWQCLSQKCAKGSSRAFPQKKKKKKAIVPSSFYIQRVWPFFLIITISPGLGNPQATHFIRLNGYSFFYLHYCIDILQHFTTKTIIFYTMSHFSPTYFDVSKAC